MTQQKKKRREEKRPGVIREERGDKWNEHKAGMEGEDGRENPK